jgi:hypothetical protein
MDNSVKKMKFKNKIDAESQVCRAFVQLGTIAGIEADTGQGPSGLSAEAVQAVYEANFDDPHFLGGPCCFNYARNSDDVRQIQSMAEAITIELMQYISKEKKSTDVELAKAEVEKITGAFNWLLNTIRSS